MEYPLLYGSESGLSFIVWFFIFLGFLVIVSTLIIFVIAMRHAWKKKKAKKVEAS